MDERSPLDNRSLSHTSREPEGQAWAQIGTKAPSVAIKKLASSPSVVGQEPISAARSSAEKSPTSPTSLQVKADAVVVEEDALSDDGRRLQVVEDAELLPANNDNVSSEGNNHNVAESAPSNVKEEEEEKAKSGGGGGGGGRGRGGRGREDEEKEEGGGHEHHRTNSGDPHMIRARVFVGHLNTEKCSRSELEELFAPFGKVTSCSLQHGYGFVQYTDEQAAKRAIRELHGLQFKGMKLVVDKTAALKRMLGENPYAPKPWNDHSDKHEVDLRRREAAVYERECAMYERIGRLDDLERMYYDRYPPSHHGMAYSRDPYYDRYYDRQYPPSHDPYMERYNRHYPADTERGRYYDDRAHAHERGSYYGEGRSSYDRPRDDPYERRDDPAFRDHQLRDREPFERFDSSHTSNRY